MSEHKHSWEVDVKYTVEGICHANCTIEGCDAELSHSEIEDNLDALMELDGLQNKYSDDGRAYQGPQCWEDRFACMQGKIDELQAANDALVAKD